MVAALAPPTTMAQVGFSPESSPYRPIRARHLFGFSGGYVWGDAGDAGVGPTNGPFGGVTFDMLFGGPVALSFNGWYADLERVVPRQARISSRRAAARASRPRSR